MIIPLGLLFLAMNIQAQEKAFLRDTVMECGKLKVRFEGGMWYKDIAKFKVIINNPTDGYALINPEDIFAQTAKDEQSAKSRRLIVVPPKDMVKFNLAFKSLRGKPSEGPLRIKIKQVNFTGQLLHAYKPLKMNVSLNGHLEFDSLSMEITEVKARGKDYVVKLLLKYKGHNFMSIASKKASIHVAAGDFTNIKKSTLFSPSNDFYIPGRNEQTLLMFFPFPNKKDELVPAELDLGEVFEVYSMRSEPGNITTLSPMTEEEHLKKKERKEEVIEEIE